jgi:hypothetical protein
MLNVLDEFTHECLAIRVARSLENSSVAILPPPNTGKDNREHCDDCRCHCRSDGGPISGL